MVLRVEVVRNYWQIRGFTDYFDGKRFPSLNGIAEKDGTTTGVCFCGFKFIAINKESGYVIFAARLYFDEAVQ